MTDYDYQQAVMDDDGFGCAITTSLAERYRAQEPKPFSPEFERLYEEYRVSGAGSWDHWLQVRDTLARRYGRAVPVTAAMVRAVMAGLEA